jgi:nucleoside-diphosphate-sugar epimerase
MSKFIIFGSNGFIGSYLLQYLKKKNINIEICDLRVDLENKKTILNFIENCNEHDRIICCIGRTVGNGINNIDYLENNFLENVRDNLFAILFLAMCCEKNNIHFTCINTGCIYMTDSEIDEEYIPNFFGSSYSIIKAHLDQLLEFTNSTLNIRIRLPITGDNHSRCLLTKLKYFTKVTNVQNSITYIPEIFPIIIQMIMSRKLGCYNMVNSGTISNYKILKLMNPTKNIEILENQNNRSNVILSNKKVQKEMNIIISDINDCILP